MEPSSKYKLSIITINLNDGIGLQRTIASVFEQNCNNFEHILIDGGSNDKSIEIIKDYVENNKERFSPLSIKWISEHDSGIYCAMNKGIKLATGQYLLFLNSGDFLQKNNVVQNVSTFFDNGIDILSGDLIYRKKGEKDIILQSPDMVDLQYCIYSGLLHPCTFIKRDLFIKYGLYNEKNKIVSDWEFFLITLGVHNSTYKKIDFPISIFMDGGVSSKQNKLLKKETIFAIWRLLPKNECIKYIIKLLRRDLLTW